MVEVFEALGKLYADYQRTTPKKLKIIDVSLHLVVLGVIDFEKSCLWLLL